MSKQFHAFAVFGKNGFPADVLRTQRAWPSSMLDSNEIIESYKRHRVGEELPYLVRLTGLTAPDAALWAKSGWHVATPDEAEVYNRLRRS